MQEAGVIQWFPGHMAKTRRKIKESLPLVDLVAEIIDARIPASSRNPELDALIGNKPRIVVLTKADLADEQATKHWLDSLEQSGVPALAVDCKTGRGVQAFHVLAQRVLAEKIAARKEKGMVNHAVRAMVAGIPNAGKSSFINRMAKGGKAQVEDRPGVTRDNRWFVAEGGIQLLDTPGILWPKFEDQTIAKRLAFTGAIKDQVMDCEELACGLLEILLEHYRPMLCERYKLDQLPEDAYDCLEEIGRRRGMLMSGGRVHTERAAIMLLDEFRGGKIGRITLERP